MYPIQLALLGAEALVMATLVLGLFRSRTLLGLSPLYIVLGGFQYLEASLSLRVEVAPGWLIYPASTVMFTATLLAVLLVYIKEETTEARKLVYGLVLANIGLTLVALIVSEHLRIPGSAVPAGLSTTSLQGNAWVAAVGTTLLLLDVIGIILVYEYVSRYTRFIYVRILFALVVVVAFDNFLFAGFLRLGRGDFIATMIAGLVSKTGATVFYATALWGYLRFIDPHDMPASEGDVVDVFQLLTYRQKYELARDRMIHDPMTGLYNRLHFDEVAPRALAHARRYEEPVSLLIIDGDHFKTINDRFSHLEGDRVLKLMGETLGAEVRAADIACRFGGDEFVVLLPRTEAEAAGALGERVRARLRESCAAASPPYPWGAITATIGIASHPADGDFTTVEDLVRVADRRLYEGKRAGRDRVVWEERSPEPAPVSTPARTAQA
jgi:diguanylate cyclase (GGDEF)-like protein